MAETTLKDAGFGGRIVTSSSVGFDAASRRFSAISERKAKLIVFPTSTDDISTAVVFATSLNLKIAVKCGGHQSSGANSVEDGLVIDLSDLRHVAIDKLRQTATVAGGCRWEDVYSALRDEELVCVGGGVHNVGVGGHVTGGGYGPLSHKFGMACDNVISATVVLADGQIVAATDSENADLLWAIKGGSSNFGIVAEFVLRTFPDQGPLFFRSVALPEDALLTTLNKLEEYVNGDHEKNRGLLPFLTFVRAPPKSQPLPVFAFTGFGAPEDFAKLFDFFLDGVEPIFDRMTTCPSLVEFSHCMDQMLLDGPPRIATSGTPITRLKPGLLKYLWDRWLEYTNSHPDATATKVMIELHSTVRQCPEASCFPVVEPIHHMILVSEEHNEKSGDQTSIDWVRDISAAVRLQHAEFTGKDLGVNGNACMQNQEVEDIWGPNYNRLRRVKAKYDPRCVFDRFWHIEPLPTKL